MWYLHTLRTFPVNLIKLLYGYSKHELFSLAPKPQDISFKLKNYFTCAGVWFTYLSVHHMHSRCLQMPEKNTESLVTRVTDASGPPCGC